METTRKVPTVNTGNIRNDEKITQAVGAYIDADKRATGTKSDACLFLFAVEMFRDDVNREALVKVHGAHGPSMSKTAKVVRFIIDRDIPTDSTVDSGTYQSVADTIRAEFGNVFAAYRTLFPPKVRDAETLAEKVARLYRKYAQETGNGPDEFALFCQGVAETVDMAGDDDDDNDDDQ
jgi:hypothetical protein